MMLSICFGSILPKTQMRESYTPSSLSHSPPLLPSYSLWFIAFLRFTFIMWGSCFLFSPSSCELSKPFPMHEIAPVWPTLLVLKRMYSFFWVISPIRYTCLICSSRAFWLNTEKKVPLNGKSVVLTMHNTNVYGAAYSVLSVWKIFLGPAAWPSS